MQRATKTKTSTKVVIAAIVVAVFAVCYGIGQHREARMASYAKNNNCEWVYSAYIDRDPICK